ncbi:MAG: acyl carrier protein [Kiritimatiellae bacterium]|nr:acyl carrier protein [Kiritimatiellia bacterium]
MPKKEKSVSDRVKDAIADAMMIEREKVTDESSFIDDLGADELDIIKIIMQLEEDFGFAIPETDAEKIVTVSQAVAYIEGHIAENQI